MYARQTRNVVMLGLVLAALWGLLAAITHDYLLRHENDFFPRWYGAREMLRGHDPYAITITPELMAAEGYGDYASPQYFLYPAPITYILLPVWLLPFATAMSVWSTLQLVLAMVLPLLIFRALGWRLSPPLLGGIALLSILGFRYTLDVFYLGQFTLFTTAGIVIAWLQLKAGRDWAAALALVLPTIRPEGMVIVAALLVLLLVKRRWRVLAIWGAIMVVLFLISVAQIGFWPDDFVDGMRLYRDLRHSDAPSEALGKPLEATGIRPVITALLTVLVVGWSLWLLREIVRQPTPTAFLWSALVVILAELLILPQTNGYALIYFLFPLWALWALSRRHPAHIRWIVALLVAPWVFYLVRIAVDDKLTDVEPTVLPLIAAVLLTVLWRSQRMQRESSPAPEKASSAGAGQRVPGGADRRSQPMGDTN